MYYWLPSYQMQFSVICTENYYIIHNDFTLQKLNQNFVADLGSFDVM